MAREVPAVDSGDVRRLKHVQPFELVPVEEMATMPAHPLERLENVLEALDHLVEGQQAEIVGARDAEQLKPDVRGRRAQGDDRLWMFLEVVGRQPLSRLADEPLEEPPMVDGITHRAIAVVGREAQLPSQGRCAQRMRDDGADQPEQNDREHDHECWTVRPPD
jgi:hypothetical protein